ncbi:MAG: zinc ribbon domain-containing protein [Candidatus Eremiobacteraeota bacterium]|nr:zinc ribbon domain-containing protein [Candidatus Eremiobacteraeota bacterium]
MLGLKAEEIFTSHLFERFQLVADQHVYRPAGHRMRGLAEVSLILAEGQAVELGLAVARAWVKAPILQEELLELVRAWAASVPEDGAGLSELVCSPGWLVSQASVEVTVGNSRLSRRLSEDESQLLLHLTDVAASVCPSCGTAGPQGARFCPSCGRSLTGRRGLWPFAR